MTNDVDLDDLLLEVADLARPAAAEGEVATYIPSVAELDPSSFGLALVEMDGSEHVTGDVDVRFPIQSISKVFSLVLAMQRAEGSTPTRSTRWCSSSTSTASPATR